MKKITTKPETKTKETKEKITTDIAARIFLGLQQLSGCEIEDFNTNLKITKNLSLLEPVSKTYNTALHAIKVKHCVKDDSGNFVIQKNQYVFKSQKDQAEYEKAILKLNSEIVDIDLYSFKASIIKDATGVKAAMLHNCREIIEMDVEITD